jgi:hypothetical protein
MVAFPPVSTTPQGKQFVSGKAQREDSTSLPLYLIQQRKTSSVFFFPISIYCDSLTSPKSFFVIQMKPHSRGETKKFHVQIE